MLTMEKIYKTLAFLFLLSPILLGIDLWLMRGYYLADCIAPMNMSLTGEGNLNMEYQIEQIRPGVFQFRITNRSFFPKFIWLYRNHERLYTLTDTMLFRCADRVKFNYPYKMSTESYGFGCGTGLGVASINPFETFITEKGYEDLAGYYSFYSNLAIRQGNVFYDPLYGQELAIMNEDQELEWCNTPHLTNADSVELQFFLPVHSIFTGKRHDIYSNPVKVAYLDLLKAQRNFSME